MNKISTQNSVWARKRPYGICAEIKTLKTERKMWFRGEKNMKKFKKQMIRVLSVCAAACFALGACAESANTATNGGLNQNEGKVTSKKFDGAFKSNHEDFFDENVVYQ